MNKILRLNRMSLAIVILVLGLFVQCKEQAKEESLSKNTPPSADTHKLAQNETVSTDDDDRPDKVKAPKGMVWIPGGSFDQGAVPNDKMAMKHEKPAHPVMVDGFFMDVTEVTNGQFEKFVKATGYITLAEQKVDWEELKKQVPPGTPKPADSILQPGSLTFKKSKSSLPNLYDFSQWWRWTIGADWRHPEGPGSDIEGKKDYPVVQIAYEDALAYCKWVGRRLPTEAEWEYASRGGSNGTPYFWGDNIEDLSKKANTWEGEFPVNNTTADGFEKWATVKSYAPNAYGLYDMAGNVWEWTSDWYNTNYYKELADSGKVAVNPSGAATPHTPSNQYIRERVVKGGSFLCSASYCASYRISARMGSPMDSSMEHIGFRTVATTDMLD